ncbi:hemerythrin domain-containing protein [Ramlibacter rhizophilus]|uniref:Hemerythrin domain-containing protein n=1 Tax=Ramlibacter rhizophilus TaxID=1781167 RepID=A0A4Z0BWL2_9BURK|nr:hemerythrin domain-containing protein [Ramlibacter rhizophilus]TFZ03291.1 hemerythrin domain-containing protein [Ramlibacter rhizophilus]
MPQQDAITLLDDDHKKVEQLFQDYEKESDRGRKDHIARTIFAELMVHTQIEEEIYYPAFRQKAKDKEALEDAKHEHQEAKQLIRQMESGGVQDAKMKELKKLIEHHVSDERETMFPESRQAGMDLDELGKRLAQRKHELMEHQTV